MALTQMTAPPTEHSGDATRDACLSRPSAQRRRSWIARVIIAATVAGLLAVVALWFSGAGLQGFSSSAAR